MIEQHDSHIDIEWENTEKVLSHNKSKNICSRYWKYILIICITGAFFGVELVVGIIIQSLVVQADAFHMLSDLMAQIIALVSYKLTFLPHSEKATFGYKRANILGGFINGIFLLSTCFYITLEAIQRFANLSEVAHNFGNVNTMIIIGAVGAAVNIFGVILFLFQCKKKKKHNHKHKEKHKEKHKDKHKDHSHSHDHGHGHDHDHNDMNVKALMLHMFGDLIGSLCVIIAGLIIKFVNDDIKYIADPIASLVVVGVLLITAIPLVKKCYNILVQAVPIEIDLNEIKKQLMEIEGIEEIHDFHVWQLSGNKNIGSMHVKLAHGKSFHEVIDKIHKIMHDNYIHATTIQPEIMNNIENCNDLVCDDERCKDNHCCKE